MSAISFTVFSRLLSKATDRWPQNNNQLQVHMTANRKERKVAAIVQSKCYSRRWNKSKAAGNA